MLKSPALVIYRTLLKQARNLDKLEKTLSAKPPISESWGSYSRTADTADNGLEIYKRLLPDLLCYPDSNQITGKSLRRCIEANFRESRAVSAEQTSLLLDEGLRAVRIIFEQIYLDTCTSVTETEGVRVEATSNFTETAVYSGTQLYVFTYRVRVTNLRSEQIQVIGRSWIVRNAKGDIETHVPLTANAIVGQQPVLSPGETFQYYSGSQLTTPTGDQSGCLAISVISFPAKGTNKQIVARINPFLLVIPSRD